MNGAVDTRVLSRGRRGTKTTEIDQKQLTPVTKYDPRLGS